MVWSWMEDLGCQGWIICFAQPANFLGNSLVLGVHVAVVLITLMGMKSEKLDCLSVVRIVPVAKFE